MPALTDVPRSSEEWRAFLQSRVAGFGRTLAAFGLGFYVLASSAAMLHPLATSTRYGKLRETEADAARSKIQSGSRMPGPLEIDLEGRGEEKTA